MGKHKKKSKHKRSQKRKGAPVEHTTHKPGSLTKRHVQIGAAFVILIVFSFIVYLNPPQLTRLLQSTFPQKADGFQTEFISPDALKPFPQLKSDSLKKEPKFGEFVGSEVCIDCHIEQYNLWKKSTHGLAGGSPNSNTVIGKFDGQPRHFKDATVIPFINEKHEYMFTVKQNGFPVKIFRADALVGGGHMIGGGTQTYFSQFPDGTLRFLPFDFIRKENIWFGETKHAKGWIPINKELSITELSEWPPSRILGSDFNFNNCQECHGSQIQINYDVQNKRYVTRYKSLSINCESCHGPGKRHVELARSNKIHDLNDIGMTPLITLSKDESLEICFRCHALKDVLHPGYLPGKDLQSYYALKFPILGTDPYHADGRVRVFGYQQNHLFSDCYLNGSMTCVDCHDPHSQGYRDITGKKLIGKFDNGQCTDCHASKGFAPAKHSHHKSDSPGNLCTSCHMPFLQHKAMGNILRFARSDHTISIPRPAFDAQLGIENACQKCHADKSIAWLQARTNEWYGQIKPHKAVVSDLLQVKTGMERKEAAQLLLNDTTNHVIAQFAGLSKFIQNYLRPNMPYLEPEIVAKLKNLSDAEDMDLKSLALMSLHLARGHVAEIHDYLVTKLQGLKSEAFPVTSRWALAMAYIGGRYRDKGELSTAILVFKKALQIVPDHPTILVNLGLTYSQKGEFDNAIACYKKALLIQPSDSMTWVDLGRTYREQGYMEYALSSYQKAVAINPYNALGFFNLGNYYYRKKDFKKAIYHYDRAVKLDPSLAKGHFYLARAYIKTGQLQNAYQSVRAGLQYAPDDQNARQMLKDLEAYLSN